MVPLVVPLAAVGDAAWSSVSKTAVAAAPSRIWPLGPSGRTMVRPTSADVQTPPLQSAPAASLASPTGTAEPGLPSVLAAGSAHPDALRSARDTADGATRYGASQRCLRCFMELSC